MRAPIAPIAAARPGAGLAISAGQLWLLAMLVLSFIAAGGASFFSSDTWWGIKMGQLSARAGRPVVEVILAHSPAIPGSVNGQWLAHLVLYLLYSLVDEAGVRTIAGLLVATAVGLVIATARQAGSNERLAALAGLLALLLAAENLLVRAQLLVLPLFALTCLLVELRPRYPRLLLLLPPLFALWANLHGTFPLGLLYVALRLAGEVIDGLAAGRRPITLLRSGPGWLLATLVGSATATLINPLGFGVYPYVVVAIDRNPFLRRVAADFLPASVQEPSGFLLAASIALLAAVLRHSRRRVAAHELMLLLVFGYLALASWRSIIWWGLVVAPILARHASAIPVPDPVSRWFGSATATRAAPPALRLALAGLILLQGALSPLWLPSLPGRAAAAGRYEVAPSPGASSFLAGLPDGSRLYHYENWTGYLAWRLWPGQQTMIEARAEALPGSVWADYAAVTFGAAEWESILERYGVGYLVLNRAVQTRLADLAAGTGRWDQIYRDDAAIVFARR